MAKADTPDRVLSQLQSVDKEEERIVLLKCPHCNHKWNPKRTPDPKYCPRCHRRRYTDQGDSLREKKPIPNLFTMERFTPAAMKMLIDMKLYSYQGPPEGLPSLTFGRQRQRAANIALCDRYLRSPLKNITDMADALDIERQGAFMRILKGFNIMLDRGCFRLTYKGRENIARGRSKATLSKSRTS